MTCRDYFRVPNLKTANAIPRDERLPNVLSANAPAHQFVRPLAATCHVSDSSIVTNSVSGHRDAVKSVRQRLSFADGTMV